MDDILGKAKVIFDKTAAVISIRSTTILETTKLKNEISTLKRQKKTVFSQVGEEVYKMKKADGINLTIIEDMVSEAELIDEKINELNIKIEEALKRQEERIREAEEKAKANEAAASEDIYDEKNEDIYDKTDGEEEIVVEVVEAVTDGAEEAVNDGHEK